MTVTFDDIRAWIKSIEGKYIDQDNYASFQCVDIPNDMADTVFHLPYSRGHGKDKATNFARDYGWKFLAPSVTARLGDVVSFKGDVWGTLYGHTGVVISDNGSTLTMIDQSPATATNPGRPATVRTVRKSEIVGYARPPISGSEPAPKPATTATAEKSHTVKYGETFWSIARLYGISVDELKAANVKVDPMELLVNTVLVIPTKAAVTPTYYTVVAGDSLWRIARQFGVSVEQLQTLNPGASDLIYPGQVLTVKA